MSCPGREICRLRHLGETGDHSLILGGGDKNTRADKNWRLSLDGSPAVPFFDHCGMAVDSSPDNKFIITSSLWGDNPGLYQYSVADKKCTTLKSGIVSFMALYSPDGKSFLYYSRLPRRNHRLPPALAQRHSRRCTHSSPQTPRLPAGRRRRQRLRRLPQSLFGRLRPPQRPRRPLLPLPKIIQQAEVGAATKFTSPARKCGTAEKEEETESRKRRIVRSCPARKCGDDPASKEPSRESDGIHQPRT